MGSFGVVAQQEVRMKAVRLHAPGGPERLIVEQVDDPRPGPGEALVRVRAAAITRDELEWPLDRLPAIPSYELAGVVEQGADGVAAGDEVYALTPFDRDGVAAEYAVVPAACLAPKPRTLDDVQSAAIPLPALSAWQALVEHGRLAESERVLIHGAAGGVGHFAVQIARARGAYVIGSCSRGTVDGAHETIGPDDAVDPVDLVFDTAGGDRLKRSPAQLGPGGRLVSIAEEPPPGSGVYFVVEPSREQLAELARLADAGALRPRIDSVHALDNARAAFERSLTARRGKVVLRP
jgi:NADPH:quinone reductase-like Zn-dependent oxidoreductase